MVQTRVDDEFALRRDSRELIIAVNREAVREAWKSSYSTFLSRAMLWCRGSRERGEDLVSRATVRILDFVSKHDRPVADARALYFLVLRNLAIDEYRAARRGAFIYDRTIDVHSEDDGWRLPTCETDIHSQLVANEGLAAVEALLERLSEETRNLFVQRFLEHRSYREIAPSLGITEAGARKRVQKLRALIVGRVAPESAETVTDRPPARLTSQASLTPGAVAHAG
jgi:RNA polymerase sigma-70 factor (ECF subfamily)